MRNNFPKEYQGYSSSLLLELWDRIADNGGASDDVPTSMIRAMDNFLHEYRLASIFTVNVQEDDWRVTGDGPALHGGHEKSLLPGERYSGPMADNEARNVGDVVAVLDGMDLGSGGEITLGDTPVCGVSGREKVTKSILASREWKLAKKGDTKAAEQVVSGVWQSASTDALRAGFNGDVPFFLVMPTSSRKNMVPVALARLLVQQLGGTGLAADHYFRSLHSKAAKDVPSSQRIQTPRIFEPRFLDPLMALIAGKHLVLVEDVLSTQGSAAQFVVALRNVGIRVDSLASLLGVPRLKAEPQLISKLTKTLKRHGATTNAKEISKNFARGEIGIMIDILNNASKEESSRLVSQLPALLKERKA